MSGSQDYDHHLVVVAVIEGQNFPKRPRHRLIVEAQFQDGRLSSEPVWHEPEPQLNTELAWEITRRNLHQHKLKRTHIKLTCYAVDIMTNNREAVGYVMLDLRQLQPFASSDPRWFTLQSSKYSKLRPALLIGLCLELEDGALDTMARPVRPTKGLKRPPVKGKASKVRVHQEVSSLANSPAKGMSVLTATLVEEEGYFTVGPVPVRQQEDVFRLSVTISSANNLVRLVPHSNPASVLSAPDYHFYFSLLGNDIVTAPFRSLLRADFRAERATVRLCSSFQTLCVFLAAQKSLAVHLCCGQQSLGCAVVAWQHLVQDGVGLVTDEHLIWQGTCTIHPVGEQQVDIDESERSSVCLEVSLRREREVQPSGAILHQDSAIGAPSVRSSPRSSDGSTTSLLVTSPVKPHQRQFHSKGNSQTNVSAGRAEEMVSASPLPVDVTSQLPMSNRVPGVGQSPTPSPHVAVPVKAPGESIPAEYSSPSSVQSVGSDSNQSMTSSVHSSPAPPQLHSSPPGLRTTSPQLPPSRVNPSEMPPSAANTSPRRPTATLAEPTPAMPLVSENRHESFVTCDGVGEEWKQDTSPHHFTYSIDLRSVRGLRPPAGSSLSIHLRYTYGFFGSLSPIVTDPPVPVTDESEYTLRKSFCAFDFASQPAQLFLQLESIPLLVEVWQGDRTNSSLLGTSQVSLAQVFQQKKQLLAAPSASGWRRCCHLDATIKSLESFQIGQLRLILTLEDHGPVSLQQRADLVEQASSFVQDRQIPLPVSASASAPLQSGVGRLSENSFGQPGNRQPVALPSDLPPAAGAASTDSIRQSIEYRKALELELWKAAEEEQIHVQLEEQKAAQLRVLTEEWKRRDRERELLVKTKVEEYEKLEMQLRSSIVDVEKRELELAASQQEAEQLRISLELQRDRLAAELRDTTERLQETFEHQLRLERSRYSDLEEQKKRLAQEVDELRLAVHAKDEEVVRIRSEVNLQPEVKLQAELNLLNLEKAQLERKLTASQQSKTHYKEQWGRALRELARHRQQEQANERDRLRQQQRELEHMRLRYLAHEEQQVTHGDKQEVELLRQELARFKALMSSNRPAVSEPSAVPAAPQPAVPSVPDVETRSTTSTVSSSREEQLVRLISERGTLLETGVYSHNDHVIQELDRQIRQLVGMTIPAGNDT